MRKLLLILPLFIFLTCRPESEPEPPPPPPPPPPPTIDQRLIGGRWYFPNDYSDTRYITPKTEDGYYKFTADSKFVFSNDSGYRTMLKGFELTEADREFYSNENEVYSKDGIVYWKENNRKVMSYEFHSSFPYQNGTTGFAYNVQRLVMNKVSSKGDLITYRLYNINGNPHGSDDFNYYFWRFLVRFNDNGTKYQDYD